MDKVWLLYALYPRDDWFNVQHGATADCECEEFLEGLFSSPEKAQTYIPEFLNDTDENLSWEISSLNDEFLIANANHDGLWYVLQPHTVD